MAGLPDPTICTKLDLEVPALPGYPDLFESLAFLAPELPPSTNFINDHHDYNHHQPAFAL